MNYRNPFMRPDRSAFGDPQPASEALAANPQCSSDGARFPPAAYRIRALPASWPHPLMSQLALSNMRHLIETDSDSAALALA